MPKNPRQFIESLAEILESDAHTLRAMSLQDLNALCLRRRGHPIERVVRQAESALQRGQKLGDGDVENAGDRRKVLNRPSRPPPEPH